MYICFTETVYIFGLTISYKSHLITIPGKWNFPSFWQHASLNLKNPGLRPGSDNEMSKGLLQGLKDRELGGCYWHSGLSRSLRHSQLIWIACLSPGTSASNLNCCWCILGGGSDSSSLWAPAAHARDLNCVLSSRIQPDSALAVGGI